MAVSNKNSKRSPQTTIIKVGANEMGKLPPQAQELEDSVLGSERSRICYVRRFSIRIRTVWSLRLFVS